MKRMHFKKRKKNGLINIIILIIILISIFIIYLLKILSDSVIPQLLDYSEIETKKIVSSVINSTVIENISKNIYDDLFKTTKTSDNSIKSIDFDSSKVTQILADTSKLIDQNIRYIEKGEVDKLNLENVNINKKGIIYEIPSGVIFNNVILNNIMPKIPVKINLIGNTFCKLNTEVSDYGINNALIKVNINIEVEVKILLPFVSKNTKITSEVPIIIKLIEGNIPSYYLDRIYN